MLSTILFFVALGVAILTILIAVAVNYVLPRIDARFVVYSGEPEWKPTLVTAGLALLCKVFGY